MERLRIYRQMEAPPLSFEQVCLEADGIAPPEDEVGWKLYDPRPVNEGAKRRATTGRLNMAGVSALSRRLMAVERARALGRKLVDLRAWALEQAGRRWAEDKAGGSS